MCVHAQCTASAFCLKRRHYCMCVCYMCCGDRSMRYGACKTTTLTACFRRTWLSLLCTTKTDCTHLGVPLGPPPLALFSDRERLTNGQYIIWLVAPDSHQFDRPKTHTTDRLYPMDRFIVCGQQSTIRRASPPPATAVEMFWNTEGIIFCDRIDACVEHT